MEIVRKVKNGNNLEISSESEKLREGFSLLAATNRMTSFYFSKRKCSFRRIDTIFIFLCTNYIGRRVHRYFLLGFRSSSVTVI